MTKFDWIYTLMRDRRLDETYRYVGVCIALKSVLTNGDMTFHVRQETVAENCGSALRTVQRAYAELREYGYIDLVQARRRGPRANADKYRLTIPELPANLAGNSEELPATGGRVTRHSRQSYPPLVAELPATTNAETSENDALKVLKRFKKGLERGAASAASHSQSIPADENNIIEAELVDDPPDPEPPQYCPDHMPHGTGTKCSGCKVARLNYERWQERNPADDSALLAVLFPSVHRDPGCRLCDGHLWLLGDDGTPIEPPVACPVCKPSRESIA